MNSKTEKSKHPYHHIIIDSDQNGVTLCIYNGNGNGGYDHWYVDKLGHERAHGMKKGSFMQDYWQDYVDLKVIQNVYKVLDFYVKEEDNVVELQPTGSGMNNFCEDDIPF